MHTLTTFVSQIRLKKAMNFVQNYSSSWLRIFLEFSEFLKYFKAFEISENTSLWEQSQFHPLRHWYVNLTLTHIRRVTSKPPFISLTEICLQNLKTKIVTLKKFGRKKIKWRTLLFYKILTSLKNLKKNVSKR